MTDTDNTSHNSTPNTDLREHVQTQVVELITRGLEEGSISEERARKIAKLILEKLPEGVSEDELMKIVPQLDDEFRELADVVVPIVTEYEEKLRKTIEAKVLELVRARKFKEAQALAREGIVMASNLT